MLPLAVRIIRTRSLLRIIWCRFMARRFRLTFLIRQSGINRGSLPFRQLFSSLSLYQVEPSAIGVQESLNPISFSLYSILTNG